MKYKIEIWQYQDITETYESDNIEDVLNGTNFIGGGFMNWAIVHLLYIKTTERCLGTKNIN